jgi:hypothetical protein
MTTPITTTPPHKRVCPSCGEGYERGQFCSRDGSRLLDAGADGTAKTVLGEAGATGPSLPESSPTAVAGDPLVGSTIAGRFEVIERLGQGGMGTVYRARHRFLDREVALKLLRPEVSDAPDVVARFEREAMAAAKIGHPNIVHVEDCGRLDDGRVYLSMELLEGVPLSSAIASEALSLGAAVDVAVEVCAGLAAAHEAGIVHRDMKADNIFLQPGGGVKILDFGIAKVSGSLVQTNLTQTGTVFGTPNYMSPEQALGKTVDHRSDVYSLGVLLYEMLTGGVPFVAETFMGVLTQHVTEPVPAPRERAPERSIPAELEAVVLRAMAKDVDDRYVDISAMQAALQDQRAALGGEPLRQLGPARVSTRQARPSSPTATAGELMATAAPAESPRRGGRSWILLLALLALGGALGLAYYLYAEVAPEPLATGAKGAAVSFSAKPRSAADRIKVVVASIPSGAEIHRDGKRIGVTPEVLWATSGRPLALELRYAGYQSKKLRLTPTADEKLTVQLQTAEQPTKTPEGPAKAQAKGGAAQPKASEARAKRRAARLRRRKRKRAKRRAKKRQLERKRKRERKPAPTRDHDHDHGGDDDHGA